MSMNSICEKMRADWDRRARENHRYYIVNSQKDWSADEFTRSGEESVARYVDTDMANVCQGKQPAGMRVLDSNTGTEWARGKNLSGNGSLRSSYSSSS